jgi:hypothetical protein
MSALVPPCEILGRIAVSLRTYLAVLTTALLIGAAPAAATADPFPPGGTPVSSSDLTPNEGHIATPADDVQHAGSWVEWWYVLLMDPHSRRQFIGLLTPSLVAGALQFADDANAFGTSSDVPVPLGGAPVLSSDDGQPGIRTSGGSISYDNSRKAYHYTMNAGFKADVWFDGNPLTGATGIIDLKQAGEWMGWTSPVASSTAHGWIQSPGGRKIDIGGWRGYHDHNWGHFTIADQQADGWEWGVSFEPDGGSHLIGGVVRTGGQWAGAVVDARPEGTRICAASTMTLSDWTSGDSPVTGSTYALPGTVDARCAPAAGGAATENASDPAWPGPYDFGTTFRLTDPVTNDLGLVAASFEARYATTPGSFGVYEHVRTLISRLTTPFRG